MQQTSINQPNQVSTSRCLIPDDSFVRSQVRQMDLPETFNTDQFVQIVNQFFDNFNVNQLSPNHINLFIQHMPINIIVDFTLPDLCDFVFNIFRFYFSINWTERLIEDRVIKSLPNEYYL